jgi:hypothetical protein
VRKQPTNVWAGIEAVLFPRADRSIVTAHADVLPWLYPAAAAGPPTLADKGYEGTGIGFIVPFKGTTSTLTPSAATQRSTPCEHRPNAPTRC